MHEPSLHAGDKARWGILHLDQDLDRFLGAHLGHAAVPAPEIEPTVADV